MTSLGWRRNSRPVPSSSSQSAVRETVCIQASSVTQKLHLWISRLWVTVGHRMLCAVRPWQRPSMWSWASRYSKRLQNHEDVRFNTRHQWTSTHIPPLWMQQSQKYLRLSTQVLLCFPDLRTVLSECNVTSHTRLRGLIWHLRPTALNAHRLGLLTFRATLSRVADIPP